MFSKKSYFLLLMMGIQTWKVELKNDILKVEPVNLIESFIFFRWNYSKVKY